MGDMATIRRDIGAGHHFIFDDILVSDPHEEMFTPEFWQLQHKITGQARGRGTTIFIKHEGQQWVLRHFKRGGLVGKVLSDQYLFAGVERSRPFEEFKLLEYMRTQGLLVPIPVAARIHRRGLIYQGDLITLGIPDSQDLHHALCNSPLNKDEWQKVGRALACMHNCQVYHHDANVRNIMIDSNKQVWLIDFDRCEQRQGDSWKQGNLNRLLRSLHKEKTKNPVFHWLESDWAACMKGYREVIK